MQMTIGQPPDTPEEMMGIMPCKFSVFVNMELLPTLLSNTDHLHRSPVWTDPFHVQLFRDEARREVLSTSSQDTTTQTKYVWTTVQRQE